MDITIISKRYAKALFDLAIEMKKLEHIKDDVMLIQQVIRENPEFSRLLRSPIIPAGKKNKIIAAIFKDKLDVLTFKFLQLVTRKERELLLDAISSSFVNLYKDYHNIITIKLTSASKIDEQSKKDLIKLLTDDTKKTIELIEETDKNLLGGFVLTMDDKKFDASIRHQLDRLKKSFDKNLYIKGF
ncbi:MAG: ATP synthase F1 subunit delta [Bacteroidales bacterium]|nr:ATP synthase F1 subunit delta [Bacteroidales bacterium]